MSDIKELLQKLKAELGALPAWAEEKLHALEHLFCADVKAEEVKAADEVVKEVEKIEPKTV